jgi:hypothetical protein
LNRLSNRCLPRGNCFPAWRTAWLLGKPTLSPAGPFLLRWVSTSRRRSIPCQQSSRRRCRAINCMVLHQPENVKRSQADSDAHSKKNAQSHKTPSAYFHGLLASKTVQDYVEADEKSISQSHCLGMLAQHPHKTLRAWADIAFEAIPRETRRAWTATKFALCL